MKETLLKLVSSIKETLLKLVSCMKETLLKLASCGGATPQKNDLILLGILSMRTDIIEIQDAFEAYRAHDPPMVRQMCLASSCLTSKGTTQNQMQTLSHYLLQVNKASCVFLNFRFFFFFLSTKKTISYWLSKYGFFMTSHAYNFLLFMNSIKRSCMLL